MIMPNAETIKRSPPGTAYSALSRIGYPEELSNTIYVFGDFSQVDVSSKMLYEDVYDSPRTLSEFLVKVQKLEKKRGDLY